MVSGSESSGRTISLAPDIDRELRPVPSLRFEREAVLVVWAFITALLLYAALIASILLEGPDRGTPILPPEIVVELVPEPAPEPDPPPPSETKEAPPPQQYFESGENTDRASGRVPDAERQEPEPAERSLSEEPEKSAAASPPEPAALAESVPEIAPPARKPEPKAAEAAKSAPKSRQESRVPLGEGGADPYVNQLEAAIKRNSSYPEVAGPMRLSGRPLFEVMLTRDGKIARIRMLRSSGIGTLDDEAVRIIRRAEPFPPVPDYILGNLIRVEMPIDISPK